MYGSLWQTKKICTTGRPTLSHFLIPLSKRCVSLTLIAQKMLLPPPSNILTFTSE